MFNLSFSSMIGSFSWILQFGILCAVYASVLELYYVVVVILLTIILSKYDVLKKLFYQFSSLLSSKTS